MSKHFDVYGIGNAIIDLQLRVTENDVQILGLEKGAMQLVDAAAQSRLMQHFGGSVLHKASGGSAANTIISIAQLGGSTSYGCIVGDDENGKFYLHEMKELGVILHNAAIPNSETGTSFILITPDAERTMNTHLGVTGSFAPKHVSEEHLKNSRWLYIEGYLFSTAEGQAAAKHAAQLAKQHGVKVAVTFSDGFIVDVFGEHLREVVGQSDLIFANANEARRFTGESDNLQAWAKLREVAPQVVMTLSEKGALVSADGQEFKIDPFMTTALDDTGAGDMFAGAYLSGISRGLSPADSGKLGCFLASKVVSQLGPRLNMNVLQLVETELHL